MIARIVIVASLATMLGACGGGGSSTPSGAAAPSGSKASDTVIARFAGKELTSADAQAAMKRLPGPSRAYLSSPDRKRQFVDNMIVNELIFEEGKRQGVADDPEIVQQVDDFRQRLVVQRVMRDIRKAPEVSDDDAKKKYDENPNLYSTTQVRASHILVKDEATAKEIYAQVVKDPSSFAALAKEKSTDLGSGRRGGELGLFGTGRMVPEFEAAAFALKAGEIGQPVKTQYGWHVIMVTERREGSVRPFDQVKAQIKNQLRNQQLQAQIDAYMNNLRAQANIQIDEAALAALTPPPQEPGEVTNPHAFMGGH